MKNKFVSLSGVKKSFKTQKELKAVRRQLTQDKAPVGCKTFGMVLKSEKDPCEDPRCMVCRNRKTQILQKAQEDLAWQKRRDSREIKGFFFGNFPTEEGLLISEGAKKGMYAFVYDPQSSAEEGEEIHIQYTFQKGSWEKVEEKE